MDDLSKNHQRIEWVDTCKCFCIICVLVSHMEYVPTVLQCVFKPFFLTCFFFLSGYVFKTNRSFRDFLLKRMKTILVPVLLFSLVYSLDLGSILHRNYSWDLFCRDIGGLLRQQRGHGDVLWFLYVTFLAEIALYFITKWFSRPAGFVISFVLCEASILYVKYIMTTPPYWYLHIIFVAMFLMICGLMVKEQKPAIIDKLYGNRWLSVALVLVYIGMCFVEYYGFHCVVNINEYGANQLAWFILVFLGIYSCSWISHNVKSNAFISFCGQNTIVFYLLHDRVRGVLNRFLMLFGVWDLCMSSQYTKLLCVIIILPIELLIVCVLTKLILRFVPFIVGKTVTVTAHEK